MRSPITNWIYGSLIAILLFLAAAVQADNELLCLNPNPSFESEVTGQQDSPAGWTWDGPKDTLRIIDQGPIGEYGTQCIEYQFTPANADKNTWFLWSEYIPIDPGKTYAQSGWLKTQGLKSGEVGPHILREFLDKDKNRIPKHPEMTPDRFQWFLASQAGVQEWTYYSQKLVPDRNPSDAVVAEDEIPANAKYVRIGFTAHWYPRKVWCDGLRFEEYRPTMIETPTAGNDKLVFASRTEKPITIDGNFNEPVWQNAQETRDFARTFCNIDQSYRIGNHTRFKIAYDDANMYFAIKCDNQGISVVTSPREHNDIKFFEDDCVELFIDPSGTRQGYFHVGITASGAVYEAFFNRPQDVGMKVIVKKNEGGWQIEAAISRERLKQLFRDVLLTENKTMWCINVTRYQPKNTKYPYTSWSFTGPGGFHVPQALGYALLADGKTTLKDQILNIQEKTQLTSEQKKLLSENKSTTMEQMVALKKDVETFMQLRDWLVKSISDASVINTETFCRLAPEVEKIPEFWKVKMDMLNRLSVSLPEDRIKYGYMIYKTPLFERPDPQQVPATNHKIDKVIIRMAKNEIEPGTFSIYTKELLKNIELTWSDFMGEKGNVLPKSAIDVRILETTGLKKEGDVLATDLRIKLDGWLDRYADKPRFIPEMSPNTSRKIWLTVRGNEKLQTGVYRGAVHIKPSNRPETSVPVEVNVLPFDLPETQKMVGFYYRGILKQPNQPPLGDNGYQFVYGLTTPDSCYREMKHLRSAGFNFVVLHPYLNGGFDPDYIKTLLSIVRKAGISKICITGIDCICNMPIPSGEKDPFEYRRKMIREKLPQILPIVKSFGFDEFYFYVMDEPNTPDDIKMSNIALEELHRQGAKGTTAFLAEFQAREVPQMDMPVLNWLETSQGGKILSDRSSGKPIPYQKVCYYSNLTAPYVSVVRLAFGWYLYKSHFDGNVPWAYYYLHNDWNPFILKDFPFDTAYYVCPTNDDPIPTLKFEAAREGVDDLRYLEYLEQLLKSSKDAKTVEACRDKLKGLLDHVSLINEKGQDSRNYKMPPETLEKFRHELQNMVLQLRTDE